jgi:uncharacterized RDD family membrane protein YckC
LPDLNISSETAPPESETQPEEFLRQNSSTSAPASREIQESLPEDTAWRHEVAARLNRYQSRRKPRPPRYPSLRLRFETEEAPRSEGNAPAEPPIFSQSSNHALALDNFQYPDASTHALDVPTAPTISEPYTHEAQSSISPAVAPTAKIIEFPRSWTPPPPNPNELAEPVMSRPRILEAPELAPPPPALGGITIEPLQQSEIEKRPGIDIPLQSAPLSRRILSAVIDDFIIAAACVLFAFIFWKVTALFPPRLEIAGITASLAALLWAAYQYLLVVYSGSTPGLRLARLELCRFDGSAANRTVRRWRVLASYLSAVSLGMGYAWVFLDEDSLCWHDRITHTYLAPKKQ